LTHEISDIPVFKSCPEDFVVDEQPLYPPSGEGGHTFVRVEKRLRTTEEVARELARSVGVSAHDVGYAGRKDRMAVARQWFSVPGLDPEHALALSLHNATVLEAACHAHKLRTGHLRCNHFEIWVRGLTPGAAESAREKLARFAQAGFANRYGDQRFGRNRDNAERGRELLLGKVRPRDRRGARFLLSALQSEVFNEVLARRPLPLDCFEPGDLAVKHESGGIFEVVDEAVENERAARFEISPTGPVFGTKAPRPGGVPGEREAEVMADLGLPPIEALSPPRGIRLPGARRTLRTRPSDLDIEVDGDALCLKFALQPGSYVTVLLSEAFGEVREGS
jgi:tRNA pseudouridine13 synthase